MPVLLAWSTKSGFVGFQANAWTSYLLVFGGLAEASPLPKRCTVGNRCKFLRHFHFLAAKLWWRNPRWNILQGLLQAGETDVIVFRPDGRIIAKESFAGCGRICAGQGCHLHFGERRERLYESTLGRGALTLGNALPFSTKERLW
jgi:hypothetical protein